MIENKDKIRETRPFGQWTQHDVLRRANTSLKDGDHFLVKANNDSNSEEAWPVVLISGSYKRQKGQVLIHPESKMEKVDELPMGPLGIDENA